jgi:LPS-assembly protein
MRRGGTIRALALGFSALMPILAHPAHGGESDAAADKVVLRGADTGTYDTDKNVLSVEGHVEIAYKGRILLADKVSYALDEDRVAADGHVSLMDENGNVTFADHVVLKNQMRDGVLSGFGALLGDTGRIAASSASRSDQGRITAARNAVYTNCKICNQPGKRTPLWRIKALRVVHDRQTHEITFEHATLELLAVPVLYTPVLSLPDPSVRYASGLLTPDTGNSSSIGYFLRLPYYLSISDSEDATVEPLISTNGGMVVLGEYRKRWQNSGLWLQGSVGENPNGGYNENQTQYYSHLFGGGRFALSDDWQTGHGWQTGFDTQISSKDTYLKRYDISQTDRLVNDVFLVGMDGRSRLSVTGYAFQSLRLSDDNRSFPVVLPLVEYTYLPQKKWFGGQFKLDVNTAAVSRDTGANDQRLSSDVSWRMPFVADDGQLWTLQLDARGDVFHTDTLAKSSDSHYALRGIPSAILDWRWPFISRGQEGRSIIFEPIAQLVAAPYGGNPDNITNEDSYSLEIDENNLFSFDHVPGRDLVESGPRANFGLRTESRFESGYIEALVGKEIRLKSDSIFSADTGQTGTSSDLVGRFSIKFPPFVDLTQRVAFDENGSKLRRNEIYLTGVYERSSIQISYLRLTETTDMPTREEINGEMDVNFYENWQAFAAFRRDLIADQTLSGEFGLGYVDECFGISLTYRQKYTSDRDLKPSTAILVHFNLKTTDQPMKPFSLFPQDVFSYSHS